MVDFYQTQVKNRRSYFMLEDHDALKKIHKKNNRRHMSSLKFYVENSADFMKFSTLKFCFSAITLFLNYSKE